MVFAVNQQHVSFCLIDELMWFSQSRPQGDFEDSYQYPCLTVSYLPWASVFTLGLSHLSNSITCWGHDRPTTVEPGLLSAGFFQNVICPHSKNHCSLLLSKIYSTWVGGYYGSVKKSLRKGYQWDSSSMVLHSVRKAWTFLLVPLYRRIL